MKCLDRFNNRMNTFGGTLRNENIISSQMLLKETFADSASYALGIYMWELGKINPEDYEGQETIKIRLYNRKFSAANGWTEQFQTLYDTKILCGDIIYNSEEDRYLICTEVFNIDDVHWQGKFTLCNWILKWQNKETGYVYQYPCYDLNSTQYNSGEKNGTTLTYGSSQHMLTLPADKNTFEIHTPQRFFLTKSVTRPISYIVSQNDSTSWFAGEKGLVKVTVVQCENNNDTDRPDLGLCDYIDPDSIDNKDNKDESTEGMIRSVISYDSKVIKSGGISQKFFGTFFDEDGNEISDMSCKWDIICDFKNKLEINQSDNYIEIGIDDDNYVDESFRLILANSSNQYSSYVIVTIESLL